MSKSPAEIAATFLGVMEMTVPPPTRFGRTPWSPAEYARAGIEKLQPAFAGEPIYGGEFNDAKSRLDSAFEGTFKALENKHRPVAGDGSAYRGGYYDANDKVTNWGAINDTLGYVSGLRSAIAMSKKAAKLKISDPYLTEVRAFLSACLPMAELVEGIKKKVVKGRRPAAVSSKEKRIAGRAGGSGTCQICAGSQAIVRGHIALHGYNRPGVGYIIGQCPGANELPFEVSCDALRKWIGTLRTMLTNTHDHLAKLPFVKSLTIEVRADDYSVWNQKYKLAPIEVGDPRFEDAREKAISAAKGRIKQLTSDISFQEKRLAGWKPVPLGA